MAMILSPGIRPEPELADSGTMSLIMNGKARSNIIGVFTMSPMRLLSI